ncbi:hypothetical protein F4801DRAFT_511902 [Xylaria longipes]|nr:hypothetical protein F4801DRAFT_511902 [Xylaria longipes]
MIIIGALSLLLLVALPVFGSGIKPESLDIFQGLDLITRATTRDIDVYDKTEEVSESQFVENEARLTRDSGSLTPSALAAVKPNRLRHERSSKSKEKDACGLHPRNDLCNDPIFSHVSSFSSSLSSSVSSAISSSVSKNDASIVSSLSAAVQTAREEGIRDGQSRASESAQNAINSAKASASSVVESIFSAVRSTPSVVGDSNRSSHGLSLDAGQLAGIVVGVFFVSSVLSVLTTLFFLWYRRRKTANTHSRHLPVEEKQKMLWPTLGKLCGKFFTSSSTASRTDDRRDSSKIFTPRLKHGRPSQSHHGIPSANRIPFASPISPSSNSDRIFPVSPLSDQLPEGFGKDSSPSLGLGLYGNRIQISSGFEDSDVPPIGLFSPIRNPTQPESPQIPVIRMGGRETNPGRLSNAWATQTFPSNERSIAFTNSQEESGMGDAINRMEGGMTTFTPIVDKSTLSPPIIPLCFSSLNAQRGPPIQRSVDLHGNDETFLLSTDEESADRDPEFSQDHSGLRSPSPSHSSIISQDITQFDPSGPGPQPASRFSMSSALVSSLGYSASSPSPAPQYHQQQQEQEQPEISPLRPAPPSPSQLQSPVPRRLNVAASLASLDPSIDRDS